MTAGFKPPLPPALTGTIPRPKKCLPQNGVSPAALEDAPEHLAKMPDAVKTLEPASARHDSIAFNTAEHRLRESWEAKKI
jgi:hypothetical protein